MSMSRTVREYIPLSCIYYTTEMNECFRYFSTLGVLRRIVCDSVSLIPRTAV